MAVEAATGTISVMLTGDAAVGMTDALGLKLHVAPAGNPEQLKFTVPANDPAAVTWKAMGEEVVPRGTAIPEGLGTVRLKSTTCSTRGTSWVVVFVSLPTSCRLNE